MDRFQLAQYKAQRIQNLFNLHEQKKKQDTEEAWQKESRGETRSGWGESKEDRARKIAQENITAQHEATTYAQTQEQRPVKLQQAKELFEHTKRMMPAEEAGAARRAERTPQPFYDETGKVGYGLFNPKTRSFDKIGLPTGYSGVPKYAPRSVMTQPLLNLYKDVFGIKDPADSTGRTWILDPNAPKFEEWAPNILTAIERNRASGDQSSKVTGKVDIVGQYLERIASGKK